MAMRRPVPSSAMTTLPIPTARGRRFGAGGRRGCRVRETCRRAAPNRVRNASLHSTLVEGIGATLATTAGASASPRRVDKRHRPHLGSTINLGPWHVERMQFCAARAFVASMRKLAPAWGSPARREDLAKPLRASRLIRTSILWLSSPMDTLRASLSAAPLQADVPGRVGPGGSASGARERAKTACWVNLLRGRNQAIPRYPALLLE